MCEFFRTKKELASKLWSVSETNSKYTSNNIYYLLLLPTSIIAIKFRNFKRIINYETNNEQRRFN